MSLLTPDQRNALYLQEAERAGIHKPILAALYAAQTKPILMDGESGLGISPANRIALEQVNTFGDQVRYAANTLRSLINKLTVEGWKSTDLWDSEQGHYTDRFIQAIANGFNAPANDPHAAILEMSDARTLKRAYIADAAIDFAAAQVPPNLTNLDNALLALVEQLPHYYLGLPYQRDALLDMVRLWRKLDTRDQAIASLNLPVSPTPASHPEVGLDPALLQFVQRISPHYSGYPHQREALIRLAQLWRQCDSREVAIVSLEKNTTPEPNLTIIDSALIDLIQRIPAQYQAQGEQRNALVEGFRLWQQLDTRSAALIVLGINFDLFSTSDPDPAQLTNAAVQLDRALLDFIQWLPIAYEGQEHQREGLIRLTQLWRGITTREQTLHSLYEDLNRMHDARRDSVDAPLPPTLSRLTPRPPHWTPANIQLFAAIIANGSFTWAEATGGGTHMPPNQATVDAIVQIAHLAQQVRDRLNRPISITNWYQPPDINARVEGVARSRHSIGDAIDFYCDGLTGDQLYWFLDSWWTGGLGRYRNYPYLVYIDARSTRARWLQ